MLGEILLNLEARDTWESSKRFCFKEGALMLFKPQIFLLDPISEGIFSKSTSS
jgi:hypothetical protein